MLIFQIFRLVEKKKLMKEHSILARYLRNSSKLFVSFFPLPHVPRDTKQELSLVH